MASRSRALLDATIPILKSIEARADLEKRIEELFDRELLDLAIARVRERVASVTWEAFRLTTFEECSGAEASKLLGSPGRIRLRGQASSSEDPQGGTRQARECAAGMNLPAIGCGNIGARLRRRPNDEWRADS